MSNGLDLQDKTRMLDTYHDINNIIDNISQLNLFPPLVWVWSWDVLKSMYRDYMPGVDDEWVTSMSLEDVWALFYEQADQNGFTLEYGTEDLYEHLRDWMIDESIIVEVDGDEEDMIESTTEEE
jgi:hypothetical protein